MDGALLLKLTIRSLIVLISFAGAFWCRDKYFSTYSVVCKLGAYGFVVMAAIIGIATCVDIGYFIVT